VHSNIHAVLVKTIEAEQAAQRDGARGVTASHRRPAVDRDHRRLRTRLATRSPLSSPPT
jgi:hypothetical protein